MYSTSSVTWCKYLHIQNFIAWGYFPMDLLTMSWFINYMGLWIQLFEIEPPIHEANFVLSIVQLVTHLTSLSGLQGPLDWFPSQASQTLLSHFGCFEYTSVSLKPAMQYIVCFQPDSVGGANGSTFGCFLVIDYFHALAKYAAFQQNCTLQLIMDSIQLQLIMDLIHELLFGFSNDQFIGSRLLILMLYSLSNPWHYILNCYVPSVPTIFSYTLLQLMGIPMLLVCRQEGVIAHHIRARPIQLKGRIQAVDFWVTNEIVAPTVPFYMIKAGKQVSTRHTASRVVHTKGRVSGIFCNAHSSTPRHDYASSIMTVKACVLSTLSSNCSIVVPLDRTQATNPSLLVVIFRLQSVQLGSFGRPSLASIKNIICFDPGILLLPWSTKHLFCGNSLVLLASVTSLFSMSVHLGFLWHMALTFRTLTCCCWGEVLLCATDGSLRGSLNVFKSCPIIHEHVEENYVSKSTTFHLPIPGQEAHRLFLGGTPSMVYSLFHGVSLHLSCVSLPEKAHTTENLITTSTSGLTPSSPYYFHCFDPGIVHTSFYGDLLLCWVPSLILYNDHTMLPIWCFDELLETTDILAFYILQDISLAASLFCLLMWCCASSGLPSSGIAAIPGHAMPQIGVQNACQLSVEVYACVPNEHVARQQRVLVDSTSTPSNITADDQGAIRDKGGTTILEIERVTDMVPVLVSFSMNGNWWFSSRHLQLPLQCTVAVYMNYSCGYSALTVQQFACYGISLLVTISYDIVISVVATSMVANVVVPNICSSVLNTVSVISFHLSAQAFTPHSRLPMQPQDDRFHLCFYGMQRPTNEGVVAQNVDSRGCTPNSDPEDCNWCFDTDNFRAEFLVELHSRLWVTVVDDTKLDCGNIVWLDRVKGCFMMYRSYIDLLQGPSLAPWEELCLWRCIVKPNLQHSGCIFQARQWLQL